MYIIHYEKVKPPETPVRIERVKGVSSFKGCRPPLEGYFKGSKHLRGPTH